MLFFTVTILTYQANGEEELAKYTKGDKLKVKVLEIKSS